MSEEAPATSGRSGRPSPRARAALSVGGLLAFAVAVFSRTLFFGYAPWFADTRELYYPWVSWLAREWAAGRWLGWCHELACGFPLWANGQSGAFYPLTLIYLLPVDNGWLLLFVTFLHHLIAAVGMFTLARRLTLGPLAAFASALVFSFAGFAWAHHLHYGFIIAVGWMPWCALAMLAWTRRRAAWGLAVVAVTLVFAAVSHPQMPIFLAAFALAIAWVAPREADGDVRVPSLLARAGLALVPIVLAVMLAAVQIVPAFRLLEAGAGGQRGGFDFFTSHSFPPTHFVTLLLPYFFGRGSGEYWASGNFEEVCGYLGGVALVLAILVIPGRPVLRRLRGRLWLIAGLALLLALGRYTPLYQLLYHVPVLNRFRVPARWLSLWSGSVALIIGIAIQTIVSGRWRRPARRRVAVVLVVLSVVCAVVAIEMVTLPEINSRALRAAVRAAGLHEREEPGPEYLARRIASFEEKQLRGTIPADLVRLGLASAVAGGILLLSATGRIGDRSTAAGLTVVLAVQVAHLAWTCYDLAPDHSPLRWPAEVIRAIEHEREEGRVVRLLRHEANASRLTENLNLVHEIPIVGVYDTMTPPAERLRHRLRERSIEPANAAALGAEIVLTDLPWWEIPPGLQPINAFALAPDAPPVRMYRNPRFEGLAWTSDRMPDEMRPPRSPQTRRVQVRRWAGRRISLEVPAGRPCALVVAASHLPEWSATVNARPVPVVEAGEVFMGVQLPAERSVVELRYRPAGIRAGLGVWAVGILLMVVIAAVSRPRSVAGRPN